MNRAALLTGLIPALALLAGCAGAASSGAGYSAPALYNAGNAYARAGKPGMAVLYYERARLLTPNDPDIEANLRYVRESSRLPPESRGGMGRVRTLGSPTVLAWLGLIGLAIIGMSVMAARRYAPYRGTRWAASVLGLALVALTVCNGVRLWPTMHEAVIITAATPVRVSPVPMGDTLFVLPEASTVSASIEHEGFVLIQTAAGQTGWVSSANLVRVVPRE